MKYVTHTLALLFGFAWSIFLLNSQLKEIHSLKGQLQVERSYSNDMDVDLNTCKNDVDYMKVSLEDLIRVQEEMR